MPDRDFFGPNEKNRAESSTSFARVSEAARHPGYVTREHKIPAVMHSSHSVPPSSSLRIEKRLYHGSPTNVERLLPGIKYDIKTISHDESFAKKAVVFLIPRSMHSCAFFCAVVDATFPRSCLRRRGHRLLRSPGVSTGSIPIEVRPIRGRVGGHFANFAEQGHHFLAKSVGIV